MTPRRVTTRPIVAQAVRPSSDLPDSLRRGLLWAPDLSTLFDPASGKRGTADGTTFSASGDYRSGNGTTDRLDWANVRDLGTVPQAHSFAGWIYPTSVAAGLRIIWTNELAAGPAQSVIFRRSGDALDFAHAYSVTGLRRLTNTGVLTVNTWHHVGYSYTGSGLAAGALIYVSGAVIGSYATSTDSSGTPRGGDGPWCLLGRQEADTECFAGRIRSPMVWDRVLAAAEFASLASLPRPA